MLKQEVLKEEMMIAYQYCLEEKPLPLPVSPSRHLQQRDTIDTDQDFEELQPQLVA